MTLSLRTIVPAAVLVLLGLVPVIAGAIDEPFYIDLFSRMLILAIGASSLNLLLGYGGMVSFGHAVYLGIGAYVVGIFSFHSVEDGIEWMASGYVQIPAALIASAVFGLIIGAISLRTRGVYFIMITLAFAQMVYFLGVGIEYYGADDGLTLYGRSEFGDWLDLNESSTLYYVCFVALLLTLFVSYKLINSRFGIAIRSIKSNERRTRAIGIPSYRYRLTCFVIAATICGFAGALLANRTDFVSPDMMHWTRSGDLIIMVVLGGMGTLFGPLLGTVGFLLVEEILSSYTEYWQLFFGPLLILIVIFGKGGIDGLIQALANLVERKPKAAAQSRDGA